MKTDFNAFDGEYVPLNKLCSIQDLEKFGIKLEEGMILDLYEPDPDSEDPSIQLEARGITYYDNKSLRWLAKLVTEIARQTYLK